VSVRSKLEARSILVTGGGGGLARALAACEWPGKYKVVAPSRQALDICDVEQVESAIATIRPAVVINTAAYTKVDLAEKAAPSVLSVNDRGCAVLCDVASRTATKLLHVSTDFVFSGALERPYRETDVTGPLNVYGQTKLRGEELVLGSADETVVVRASWLLSGRAGFIPAVLARAQKRAALDVVSDQNGTPTDIDDLACALRDIALRMTEGGGLRRIYHVAGVEEATWYDVAGAVVAAWAERTGAARPVVRPVTSKEWGADAARPANSRLDSSAFQRDFGYGLPSWRSKVVNWVAAFERGRA